MNTKRYALAAVATFVFVFVLEFLWHGVGMMSLYESTSDVWRPQEETNMAFLTASQVVYALVIAFIFTRNYEGKGVGEGVRFGLMMGLLVGSIQIGTYAFLPVPLTIPLLWVAAEVVKGIGAGVVLSLTYRS